MSLNMSEGQIWMCLISGHKVRLVDVVLLCLWVHTNFDMLSENLAEFYAEMDILLA